MVLASHVNTARTSEADNEKKKTEEFNLNALICTLLYVKRAKAAVTSEDRCDSENISEVMKIRDDVKVIPKKTTVMGVIK